MQHFAGSDHNGHTHEHFVALFHAIGEDRDNCAVILAGTGHAFLDEISPDGFDFFTPLGYNMIFRKGRKVLRQVKPNSRAAGNARRSPPGRLPENPSRTRSCNFWKRVMKDQQGARWFRNTAACGTSAHINASEQDRSFLLLFCKKEALAFLPYAALLFADP